MAKILWNYFPVRGFLTDYVCHRLIIGFAALFCLTGTLSAQQQKAPQTQLHGDYQIRYETMRFELNQPIELPLGQGISGETLDQVLRKLKERNSFRSFDYHGGRQGTYSFVKEAAIELDALPFASIAPVPDLMYPGEVLFVTAKVENDQINARFRFEKDQGVAEVKAEDKKSFQAEVRFNSGDKIIFGGRNSSGKYSYLVVSLKVPNFVKGSDAASLTKIKKTNLNQ